MFSNEDIEINTSVFDYFRNAVLSTAVVIQHAHQLWWSAYIVSHINVSTYNIHHYYCQVPINHAYSRSCECVKIIRKNSPVEMLMMWMKNGTMEFCYDLTLSLCSITPVVFDKVLLIQFNIASMSDMTQDTHVYYQEHWCGQYTLSLDSSHAHQGEHRLKHNKEKASYHNIPLFKEWSTNFLRCFIISNIILKYITTIQTN